MISYHAEAWEVLPQEEKWRRYPDSCPLVWLGPLKAVGIWDDTSAAQEPVKYSVDLPKVWLPVSRWDLERGLYVAEVPLFPKS